jgi:hypothetical protein
MKVYGGAAVSIYVFLTSALVGGKCSASCPGRFTPWEEPPVVGWGEPTISLGDLEKRKFLPPSGLELRHLGRPVRSQSLYRLRYPDSICIKIFL